MRATLCEYASVNPDGTATLVRAGIARIVSSGLPLLFGAAVYAEIRSGELENGPHDMLLEVVGAKGTAFKVQATLTVVDSREASRIVLPFLAKIEFYGKYRVTLKVGTLQDDLVVTLDEVPPKKGTMETPNAGTG